MAKINHQQAGRGHIARATLAILASSCFAAHEATASDLYAGWIGESEAPVVAPASVEQDRTQPQACDVADLAECWNSAGFAARPLAETPAPITDQAVAQVIARRPRRTVSGDCLGFDFGPTPQSIKPAPPSNLGNVASAWGQELGFNSDRAPTRRPIEPATPIAGSREPRAFTFVAEQVEASADPPVARTAKAPAAPESDFAAFLAPGGVTRGKFVADPPAPVLVAAQPVAPAATDPVDSDDQDGFYNEDLYQHVVEVETTPLAPASSGTSTPDRTAAEIEPEDLFAFAQTAPPNPTVFEPKPQQAAEEPLDKVVEGPVARVAGITGTHTEIISPEPHRVYETPLTPSEVIEYDASIPAGSCYPGSYACRQHLRYDLMLGTQPLQALSVDTRARIEERDGESDEKTIRIADESDLDSTYVVTDGKNPITFVPYADATSIAAGCPRYDASYGYYWLAPSLFHRPLYFEQPNVERYGHYLYGDCVQSAVSAAHFFSSVAILPYKVGASPHQACDYTLGRYRPGSCNPRRLTFEPFSARGALYQGLTVTGLVFLIP